MKSTVLFIVIFIISSNFIFSQPLPPFNHGHGAKSNQTAGAPLDGGLSFLLGFGILYGAKKLGIAKKKINKHI